MKPNKLFFVFAADALIIFATSTSWSMPKLKMGSSMDPEKYAKIVESIAPFKDAANESPYITPEQFEKLKAEIATQRAPANGDASPSPEFKKLADELMKISAMPRPSYNRNKPELITTNTGNLDSFLKKLDADYLTYKENDTKLFASQLIPLRKMRGVVWKMIGLFEGRKTHPAHTLSLTAFKDFAGKLGIAFPDKSWEVGFDYITQPYAFETGFSEQFSSMAEFQGFIGNFFDAVNKSKNQLETIDVSDAGPVVFWDQKILFGPKSFKDDLGRYKRVGTLEKHMLLSNIFFSLSQLAFMQAYSLNGALDLSADFGWRFGIDGKFLAGVEGVTAKEVHDVLRAHPDVGGELPERVAKVKSAIRNLRNSVLALNLVWTTAKTRGAGGLWLVDSGFTMRDAAFADKKIKELSEALIAKVTIRNKLTGEFTTMNMPAFFNEGGPSRLSDLMPKEPFDPGITGKGDEWIPVSLKNKMGHAQSLKFRDYRKGSPMTWDFEKYHSIFPDVKSNEDLKKAFRVFNSTFASFSSVELFKPLQQ